MTPDEIAAIHLKLDALVIECAKNTADNAVIKRLLYIMLTAMLGVGGVATYGVVA